MDYSVVELCLKMSIKKWWFTRIAKYEDVRKLNSKLFMACANIHGAENLAIEDCALQTRS